MIFIDIKFADLDSRLRVKTGNSEEAWRDVTLNKSRRLEVSVSLEKNLHKKLE